MIKTSPKNLIIAAAVIGILIIPGLTVYLTKEKCAESALNPEAAGEKAVNYINDNFLQGKEGASLISAIKDNEFFKLTLRAEGEEFNTYVTKDGKFLFFQAPIDLDEKPEATPEQGSGSSSSDSLTIGNFSVSQDSVCKEQDRPVVYFFGSKTCLHCAWEHPVMQNVASSFGENIIFHDNMDSDKDTEVFSRYSAGYVPTLILGCKYYRIGSGETLGEQGETEILTALICKLTENKPDDVCNGVQDLINQAE